MVKIVTLGSATKDIFLLRPNENQIKRYVLDHTICISEGTKNNVEQIHYAIGGGAINASVALRQLGHEVFPCCRVGNDDAGNFVVQELQQKGISTQAICCDEEHPTGISCIISCCGSDSILLVYRGVNNYLAGNFNKLLCEWKDLIGIPFWYCGPLSGDAAIQFSHLLTTIRPNVTTIAVNPSSFQLGVGYEHFRPALPNIDIIMLNTREARILAESLPNTTLPPVEIHDHYDSPGIPLLMQRFYRQDTVLTFARRVMQHGPQVIVITDGAHGVYVIDKHHVYFHPSFSLNVLNTVGAGDAFGSTFFAYLIIGEPIVSALSRAMINSAAVLYSIDSTSGLLTAQELQKRYELQGSGQVQEFMYEIIKEQ
jgi:sugar/nucleoside kinase (ribokinase family)